jgi:hypothetical protein
VGVPATAHAATNGKRSTRVVFADPTGAKVQGRPGGVTAAATTPAATPAAVTGFDCGPQPRVVTRTDSCTFVPDAMIEFLVADEVVGFIQFAMSRHITLNARGRYFSEHDQLRVVDTFGEYYGSVLQSWTVACDDPCTATAHLPGETVITSGLDLEGTVRYRDLTTSRHTGQIVHTLMIDNPAFPPPQEITLLSPPIRCDNQLRGYWPGCVFPEAWPTVDFSALPTIGRNVRTVQAAGPHHYGSEALSGGDNPLHRATDPDVRRANNRAACGDQVSPFPGFLTCDEYPLASTYEGASFTTQPDWGIIWAPVYEQGVQSVIINGFYLDNRILEEDPFWVTA